MVITVTNLHITTSKYTHTHTIYCGNSYPASTCSRPTQQCQRKKRKKSSASACYRLSSIWSLLLPLLLLLLVFPISVSSLAHTYLFHRCCRSCSCAMALFVGADAFRRISISRRDQVTYFYVPACPVNVYWLKLDYYMHPTCICFGQVVGEWNREW